MTAKKIPMRKCLGCGEMLPKKELVRVVKTKTGEEDGKESYVISLDKTGKAAGRGAYGNKNSWGNAPLAGRSAGCAFPVSRPLFKIRHRV